MEQVNKIRSLLLECGLLSEAQEVVTPFTADKTEEELFKKEDDKSYKEDRTDLEGILNSTGRKKRDYVRNIIKTINQMIDGKKDVTNLITVVKKGKKR